MDYTAENLGFKIRKALRYIRLYGLTRTWVKIQGQYHMKRRFDPLPPQGDPAPEGGHVGLIGCGNYAFSNIAHYLHKRRHGVMRAAMDVDIHRAASLYQKYGLRYYTDDARRIINDPAIDLVYIASNHASHAEYAIQALDAGKNAHIEKPHVVSENQLLRLCRAASRSRGRVNLGFNRPGSPIGRAIKERLASQEGPVMMNWFIAGHEISADHWYFKEEEGGRVLGNLCHWTDFVYQMVDAERRYPITITPTRGAKSDCDIAVTFLFGDESIAAITFSAKGHTFEGVRERFAAHRGDVLIAMDDFQTLTVEVIEKKHRIRRLFRDHGHEANILRSYDMAREGVTGNDESTIAYIWETGELFLKTREALEKNAAVLVEAFSRDRLFSAKSPS